MNFTRILLFTGALWKGALWSLPKVGWKTQGMGKTVMPWQAKKKFCNAQCQ